MNETLQPPVLEAVGVERVYREAGLQVRVLEAIDLTVRAGDTVALLGASGSGKSTLLQLLGGLDQPSAGAVRLMGQDWTQLGVRAQGEWRNRHLGFVYQFHHLLPEFSALDNVAMPLRIRRCGQSEARAQALEVLQAVGLAERAHHRPSELSGGERQRVAVARALVTRPACVLADEPTGNLDRRTADAVFQRLLDGAQAQGTALVVVTHDETLAQRCAHRLRLTAGRLVSEGPVAP